MVSLTIASIFLFFAVISLLNFAKSIENEDEDFTFLSFWMMIMFLFFGIIFLNLKGS